MRTRTVFFAVLFPFCISHAIEVKQKGANVATSNILADSLLRQADETFQSSDYKAALERYQATVDKARDEFNHSIEVEALSQVARMHLILGEKEEGRKWLEQAGAKVTDSDPMGWSRYLGVRGRFEWKDNDLETARKTFNEMYEYCNANALWGRAVDAAHMIAIVAEKPEEQIEWGRRGIEAAEAGNVESWLGPLWNNLAGTYYDIKQYDSALECYLKAREYHWRHSGEIGKLIADYHVGMTYRLLGNYNEAGKWLRPVLAWAERIENHSIIGQACQDLGEIEIAQGRKTGGLELLKRARSEYKLEGLDKTWPEVWKQINMSIRELEG